MFSWLIEHEREKIELLLKVEVRVSKLDLGVE